MRECARGAAANPHCHRTRDSRAGSGETLLSGSGGHGEGRGATAKVSSQVRCWSRLKGYRSAAGGGRGGRGGDGGARPTPQQRRRGRGKVGHTCLGVNLLRLLEQVARETGADARPLIARVQRRGLVGAKASARGRTGGGREVERRGEGRAATAPVQSGARDGWLRPMREHGMLRERRCCWEVMSWQLERGDLHVLMVLNQKASII